MIFEIHITRTSGDFCYFVKAKSKKKAEEILLFVFGVRTKIHSNKKVKDAPANVGFIEECFEGVRFIRYGTDCKPIYKQLMKTNKNEKRRQK